MDYKLIALDIDGTLTNSQKEITPRTRYALMEAQKQGKKIILASGRHPVWRCGAWYHGGDTGSRYDQ